MIRFTTTPGRLVLYGVLLSALLYPAALLAENYVLYEGTLPGPTGITQLQRPSSVSVNAESGEICVTDDGTFSLHVYNLRNIHTYGTGGIAGISSPKDGSIDSRGGFVVTDGAEGGIGRTLKRLNYYGEPIPYEPVKPVEKWFPVHVLIARNGDYISVDHHTGVIARHNSETGELVWAHDLSADLGDQGAHLGQPAEAPDGNIYVPGGELQTVLVFSPEGKRLTSFGSQGTRTGGFAFPVGVAFGPRGIILVLDRMRHNVILFDAEYNFIGEYGRPGTQPGLFYHPVAITALPDGRFWVAQGYRGRVQAFRLLETDNGNPKVRRISS